MGGPDRGTEQDAALAEWSQLRVVVLAELASEVPALLDGAVRASAVSSGIRPLDGNVMSEAPGFAVDDRHPGTVLEIDVVVRVPTEPTRCSWVPVADGPGHSARTPRMMRSCQIPVRVSATSSSGEDRTLARSTLERSYRRVRPVPLKIRMAVGCPGDFPLFGVGGSEPAPSRSRRRPALRLHTERREVPPPYDCSFHATIQRDSWHSTNSLIKSPLTGRDNVNGRT